MELVTGVCFTAQSTASSFCPIVPGAIVNSAEDIESVIQFVDENSLVTLTTRVGAILVKSNANSESSNPRRRVMKATRILAFLAFFWIWPYALAQQDTLPASVLTGSSPLPDAPDAQGSALGRKADQSNLGSIHGVVADKAGPVFEGAHIALSQAESIGREVRNSISDSNGRFNFPDVLPGPFELTVSSSGFATQVIFGVLHTGESYDALAIVLPINSATTEVRVTASAEQIAQEQVIQEEKQRVLGIIPNFYVAYAPDPAPLNSRQKFELAWKSSIDPIAFLTAGALAGVEQANNTFSAYGHGAQGYAKRFGANYTDTFIGTMMGSAVLPSLLKQDPRYFYKGAGTIRSRAFHAIASAVICKGDNGHWQPSYSGFIGGLAAGGISNFYYPARNRYGLSLTFENALTGIAGGAVQNLFQEFFIRKLTPKVPDYSQLKP
jgi:hypothetical protein